MEPDHAHRGDVQNRPWNDLREPDDDDQVGPQLLDRLGMAADLVDLVQYGGPDEIVEGAEAGDGASAAFVEHKDPDEVDARMVAQDLDRPTPVVDTADEDHAAGRA